MVVLIKRNEDVLLNITDSLLCPWGKEVLTFSLKSTSLITADIFYGPLCRVRINEV